MEFLLKEAVKVGNMPFPDKHRCCAGSSVGMEKWEWCLLLYNNPHFFFLNRLCFSVRVHGHGSKVLGSTTRKGPCLPCCYSLSCWARKTGFVGSHHSRQFAHGFQQKFLSHSQEDFTANYRCLTRRQCQFLLFFSELF